MTKREQPELRRGLERAVTMLCLAIALPGCVADSKRAERLTPTGSWRGAGLYEVTAQVPPSAPEDLSVFIRRRTGLESARIGERELFEQGAPPTWPQFAIRPQERGAALVLRYRTWYPINANIVAGPSEALTAAVLGEDLGPFCTGWLLAIAGLFAALGRLRRPQPEVLLISAFACCTGVRHLTEAWSLYGFWGAAAIRPQLVHDLAIMGLTASLTAFVGRLFPARAASAGKVILYGTLGLAGLTLVLDLLHLVPSPTPRIVSMSLVVAMCVWLLVVLIPLARQGTRHARTFLFGLGALICLSIPDIANGTQLVEVPAMGFVGDLLFVGALAVALSQKVENDQDALKRTLGELHAKVDALEEKHREVASLNVELRYQIAERSKALPHVLTSTEDGDGAASELSAGALVGGRYRVVRALGSGAMGSVYEVERTTDGARLALKMMTMVRGGAHAARFAREAEIAARVAHPNLVSVFDVGVGTGGSPYIVMELIRGGSLEAQSDHGGDLRFVAAVLRGTASALAELHRAGVVHRDLKPANILVARAAEGPVVKIADFGIARWIQPEALPDEDTVPAKDAKLTHTGAFMGTPRYMAPEQAIGAERVGPGADVYSFGIVAFELLCGRYPFPAPPVFRALAGVPAAPPDESFAMIPGLGVGLASVLDRCLAPDPAGRATSREVADALAAWEPEGNAP